MKARDVCLRAADLVAGDRARQHGDAVRVHRKIAALWGAYLGTPITAEQVAWMMALVKIGRASCGARNPDNPIDVAGYAGIAAEVGGEDV